MIEKVISGGQVGADIAGLRAAHSLGIATGGHAPKGYRTRNGRNPQLAAYGLVEHSDWRYPPRTRENARGSDGTIRFAADWDTAGERATLREVQAAGKPCLDVTLSREAATAESPAHWAYDVPPTAAREWLLINHIHVLNVAGNGNPEIEEVVETYLLKMLS